MTALSSSLIDMTRKLCRLNFDLGWASARYGDDKELYEERYKVQSKVEAAIAAMGAVDYAASGVIDRGLPESNTATSTAPASPSEISVVDEPWKIIDAVGTIIADTYDPEYRDHRKNSEVLRKLRPYLRTTESEVTMHITDMTGKTHSFPERKPEPVSVKEIRHKVTHNGGLCNEDAVVAVLDAAGVKYVS